MANTGHDYSMAEKRGTLTYLYEGKVNVFASDKLGRELEDKLADSNTSDYMILSGNQLAAAMAFHIMMKKNGLVNVLLYSFKNQEYEVRTIRMLSKAEA